jgi:hypothetical protein
MRDDVASQRNDEVVAWEWVGQAGTAVVGLAGIAATYLSGRRQVVAARQTAMDQADAARQSQREERHQRRLEVAYPKLLDVIAEADGWLHELEAFNGAESDVAPQTPIVVDQLLGHGSITVIWSPMITHLVHEWGDTVLEADSAGRQLAPLHASGLRATGDEAAWDATIADVRSGKVSWIDYLTVELMSQTRKLQALQGRIHDQVWRELRGDSDGYLAEESP